MRSATCSKARFRQNDKVGDDDSKHAAVLAAACTCPLLWNSRLGVLFVTSQALSCGAIYFAEACGKSVAVGFATP